MNKQRKQFLEQPAKGYPIWGGIDFVSVDVGVRHDTYLHNGYRYVTKGEMITAQLLDAQGIAYTPDVSICMRKHTVSDSGRHKYKSVIYIPDFIFNRDSYIWTEPSGDEYIIYGIECKASSSGISDKVRLLFKRRNIRVIVLGEKEIIDYQNKGGFPLKLLHRTGRRT
ncbi:MAG: hypothetical protein V1738_05455 [Patescibacteria group bacterium]